MRKLCMAAAAAAALLGVGAQATSAATVTACYSASVTVNDTAVSDARCETVSAP